jgi:hypothetical protein
MTMAMEIGAGMDDRSDRRKIERGKRLKAKRNRRYYARKKKHERLTSRLKFMGTDKQIIAAIVHRRRALGLSQLALDQATGNPDGWQGKIECGAKNPGLRSLSLILQALGLGIVLVPGEAPRVVQAVRPQRRKRK